VEVREAPVQCSELTVGALASSRKSFLFLGISVCKLIVFAWDPRGQKKMQALTLARSHLVVSISTAIQWPLVHSFQSKKAKLTEVTAEHLLPLRNLLSNSVHLLQVYLRTELYKDLCTLCTELYKRSEPYFGTE
jgi:hypothetical protein